MERAILLSKMEKERGVSKRWNPVTVSRKQDTSEMKPVNRAARRAIASNNKKGVADVNV